MAPAVKRRMRHALRLLTEDPSGLTNKLNVKRLDFNPGQPIYRLRVGEWRAAFTVDSAVVVLRIFHRSEGYGWLVGME